MVGEGDKKSNYLYDIFLNDLRLNEAVHAARKQKDFAGILEMLEEYEHLLTPNPKARRAFSVLRLQVCTQGY